jgi:hypothetical protein
MNQVTALGVVAIILSIGAIAVVLPGIIRRFRGYRECKTCMGLGIHPSLVSMCPECGGKGWVKPVMKYEVGEMKGMTLVLDGPIPDWAVDSSVPDTGNMLSVIVPSDGRFLTSSPGDDPEKQVVKYDRVLSCDPDEGGE